MRLARSGLIIKLLILILLINFIVPGFPGNHRAEAGFLSDNKDSIFTLVKGLAMLYIMSLFTGDSSGEEDEDGFLTSTIKNGLNFGSSADEPEVEAEGTESSGEDKDYAKEMLEQINAIRLEEGLQPLQADDRLAAVARRKAQDMIENDYFAHDSPDHGTPFDMLQEEGIGYALAGENLAAADSINSALDKLMESPEHRDNILEERFDKIGLGIVEGGSSRFTIVQLYIASPAVSE